MAIKIEFDSSYSVMQPTLVLATRNGNKLGGLNYHNLVMKDSMINCSELSFKINKNDCTQNQGKTEKSHVKPILVSNIIQSVGGYTYFSTLTKSEFNQLVGYFKSGKTSNPVLTFTIAGTTQKFEVTLSQINDYRTLFVNSKADDMEIIKIESSGDIYINNTNELNLAVNTACQIKLEFDIIIDLYNDSLWKSITDFKLVWVKEWDKWFEIYVSLDESETTIKNITAKSLGEAELSQVNLYNIQINTEDDIARDDYVVTVLYNPDNKQGSLLHRITEKVPHYNIVWVDTSIKNIQRTFTFDGKSIYDAFQEIAEEMECIFEINCHSLADGGIARDIYVYDINSYGSDTNILLSADTLADNINYSVDDGSVKNCFRLEAGDDLMTAAVRNCNPNGSGYIWYISDNLKDDMSENLVEKLNSYNKLYDYLQNYYNPFDSDIDSLTGKFLVKRLLENFGQGGNVNLLLRPLVDSSELIKVGWDEEEGYTATVFTNTFTDPDETVAVNFTPIVVDSNGKYIKTLSPQEITEYAEGVINGDRKDDLCLQIGSPFTGGNVIDKAVNVAEIIHELQDYYYLGDENTDGEFISHEIIEANQSYIANYTNVIESYNNIVKKYSKYTSKYKEIVSPLIGYPAIMETYYDTIDFYYYLNDGLMPTVTMSETNAQKEGDKLNYQSLKNTAVQNLSSFTSVATVSSAVLAMAKVLVSPNYQVKILDEETYFTYSEDQSKWKGKFVITNYSDETDTYTTMQQTVIISSDYATFIKQKLDIALSNTKTDTISDIDELFKLGDLDFKKELKKYSLQRLRAFHDACQGCLDILQQQGIADDRNEDNDEIANIYNTIYLPYYNKLGYIQSEMDIRQSELDIIQGKFDENGGILEQGMQTILQNEQNTIQDNLNFQEYLGEDLWLEFAAYRREDTYSNDNYISDGLDNPELFDKAMEFIQTAKDEIEKSATLQHTITATLKNLLVMKEFRSIVDYFEVGNWLRIKVDGVMYKLRLVDYQIDFDSLENIDITFSDITVDNSGVNSVKDVLNQAASMATTYNAITRQARRGSESAGVLNDWVDKGLLLTTTKIVDKADNQEVTWDKHGLICREYDSVSDSYSDKQLKLINKGLYVTDNNWRTAKAGIGNFTFFNPSANNGEGEWQEGYGVIADTLVGNLILGKNVGIYNTTNSITMDENGFIMTTNETQDDAPQSVFTIRRKTISNGITEYKNMFYIDSNGYVTINGGVKIETENSQGDTTLVEMVDGKITIHITEELDNGGLIQSAVAQTANEIKSTVSSAVSKYDTTGYTITISGYGMPTTSSNNFAASSYNGKYYLDQNNGNLYLSNGSSWSNVKTLNLITTNLQTQITQNATDITSKVSSDDVHTIIQQTPEDVRIAWNGISNYISFEDAAIKIKNSSNNLLMQLSNNGLNLYNSSSALLMNLNNNGMNLYDSNNALLMRLGSNGMNLYDTSNVLLMCLNSSGLGLYESDGNSGNRLTMRMNRSGANYYNEGNFIGSIGTNKMAGDSTIRGLTFNLETVADGDTARYMSWGYRNNSNDDAYTIKMAYYTNDFNYTRPSTHTQQNWKKGFHFADDVYFRYDAHIGNNGYIGYYNDGIILENTVNNSTNSFLRFTGGRGATVKLDEDINISAATGKLSSYVDFYMNNHIIYDSVISSSSDARLKKNISSSSEMALSLLNKIDISQFDWIETDEHIAAGFIAQQLQEVIPKAVLENPETTRLSIRTDILIPYIIKAIQELTECIGTDNKYKGVLQSIGITTSKNKEKWKDKMGLSEKNKFISSSQSAINQDDMFDENTRKRKEIILPG